MKHKLLIILLLSILTINGEAQIFDKYGVNIGASYSTQNWDYKLVPISTSYIDYKVGLAIFIFAEREINKLFSFKPEIGYIQKGFVDNNEFVNVDGSSAGMIDKNVIFHDLELNIGLKITPFTIKLKPYGLLGIYGDYMLGYKDAVFKENGSGHEFNVYEDQIEDFNKSNLGCFVGLGLEAYKKIYIEFTVSPTFTNRFNDSSLKINDNSMELKLGFNIK